MRPRDEYYRDEKYLKWIRKQPSFLSGQFWRYEEQSGEVFNDPSHTWGTGGKTRRNDYCALPLTREEHTELENIGEKAFEKKYNIDFMEQIALHLMKFLGEKNQ